jgi:hypothetical protein
MSDELVKRIKEDLEKHGFPLEIKISHLLENNGWTVIDKYSFVDEETSKTREVDCVAMKGSASTQKIDLDQDLHASMEKKFDALRIIVECKKSSKPWLFYATQRDYLSILFTKFLGNNPIKFPTKDKQDMLRNQEYAKNLHQYSVETKLAKNYFEPFTQGEGNQILDATMKVVKALRYDSKKIEALAAQWKLSNFFLLYYPVIVFEGNLYEYVIEKEEVKISPTAYLQLTCGYLDQVYRIDVVSSNYFPDFLGHLELEIEGLKKFWSAN